MRISRVIISAVFIMIVGACFTAAAKEGAVPVLSFELEDGTQILDQDNVIKASLINRTDNLGNLEFMIEITFDEEGKEIGLGYIAHKLNVDKDSVRNSFKRFKKKHMQP